MKSRETRVTGSLTNRTSARLSPTSPPSRWKRIAAGRLRQDCANLSVNLELFFSQSLDGFFFMMLDEPIRWGQDIDQEAVLDYVFQHQHMIKVNEALLQQYGASAEQFLGSTPHDLFVHDLAHGRDLWRRMFDAGRIHVESDERRLDGSRMWVEGDYICFYDAEGRITGHFGIQRDVTERKQAEEALFRFNQRLKTPSTDRPRDSGSPLHRGYCQRSGRACSRVGSVPAGQRRGVRRGCRLRVALWAFVLRATRRWKWEQKSRWGSSATLTSCGQGKAHIVSDVDQMAGEEMVVVCRREGIRSFVNIPAGRR